MLKASAPRLAWVADGNVSRYKRRSFLPFFLPARYMVAFHACIFAPYVDCSGVIDAWSKKCHAMLVVEHPADGKTKRIHSHVVMGGTSAKDDWYRESAKEIMKDFIKRGNYWIASKVADGEHKGKPIDYQLTAVYMLKGKYAAKYSQNNSPADLEQWKGTWVESSLENDKTPSASNHIETKVYHMFDKYHFDYELPQGSINRFNERESCYEQLFKDVRSNIMKQWFREYHKSPHGTQYKMMASTVFLRIAERLNCTDQAIEVLLKSWY